MCMQTDEFIDYGIVNKIIEAGTFQGFSDDEIAMYMSYKMQQASNETMLSEYAATLKAQRDASEAAMEAYTLQAQNMLSSISENRSVPRRLSYE